MRYLHNVELKDDRVMGKCLQLNQSQRAWTKQLRNIARLAVNSASNQILFPNILEGFGLGLDIDRDLEVGFRIKPMN